MSQLFVLTKPETSTLKPEPSKVAPQASKPSRSRNILWLLFERCLRLSLGLGSIILIARYLGPQQYGLLALAMSWAALFLAFADLGMFGLVVKELISRPNHAGRIIGTVLLSRGIAALVLVFVAVMAAQYHHSDPMFLWLVALIGAGSTCRCFDALDVWFQSHEQAQQAARLRAAVFAVVVVLRLVLVAVAAPIWVFALLVGLEPIFVAAGLVLAYRRSALPKPARWSFSAPELTLLLSKSWPLLLSGIAAMIYLKIDQVMLGYLVNEEAVGVYAIAAQISEAGWFVPQAIVTAWFPALVLLRDTQPRQYLSQLQRIYDQLFMLALLLAVGVAVVVAPLLPWVFGPEYEPAITLLLIHIWSAVFIFMRALLSRWLINESLLIFSLTTHGLGALVNVLLNAWWIPQYGGVGAAWATVFSYFVAGYLALWLHPKTWPAARMMSVAMLAPVRWPLRLLRGQTV